MVIFLILHHESCINFSYFIQLKCLVLKFSCAADFCTKTHFTCCTFICSKKNFLYPSFSSIHRFLHPIYYGDYPQVMREHLGDSLPKFTQEEKDLLRNAVDFIGLNHYTSRFIAHDENSLENCYYYKAQKMERIGTVPKLHIKFSQWSSLSLLIVLFIIRSIRMWWINWREGNGSLLITYGMKLTRCSSKWQFS